MGLTGCARLRIGPRAARNVLPMGAVSVPIVWPPAYRIRTSIAAHRRASAVGDCLLAHVIGITSLRAGATTAASERADSPCLSEKVPGQAHSPAWSRARHLDSDIATTMPTPSTSQTFPRDRSDAVCIIGTGPAGLSAARAFKAQGLDYDQFERHGDLVGIWDVGNPGSPICEATHFISWRDLSAFIGHPMPRH